jgi:two-component system sensor histidine kinase TctE
MPTTRPPDTEADTSTIETTAGTSLRRSLLGALVAPILVALLAGGVFGYRAAEKVVSTAYDQSLLNLANGIANRARVENGDITIALSAEEETLLRTDTIDRIYFRVRDDSGRIIAGDADLPPPELPTHDFPPHFSELPQPEIQARTPRTYQMGPQHYYFEGYYRGETIRGVRFHPFVENHGFYVTVAETLGKRNEAIRDLLVGFGVAVLLVLAAFGAVVHYGIPSGLASLRDLEEELAGRSGQDLAPVDLSNVPLEIREVVRALNALLIRLREANAVQREFLQDAAHQLRTPLAGLQVQIELLHSGQTDPAASKNLRKSVTRVTRLANQLLALARAEAGHHLMTNASPLDLAEIIDDMLEEWLRVADEKSIDFGVQRDVSKITADPTLLRELIANLVDNALKYTPTGGQVTLRCERIGDTLEIDVSDNGQGIPAHERERVFERFHRLPDAMASGSGLGLPIAREIVAGHHGSIVIVSGEGGKGTCIQVRLPIKPPFTPAACRAAPPSASPR